MSGRNRPRSPRISICPLIVALTIVNVHDMFLSGAKSRGRARNPGPQFL
jgi:hypothetical protein